MLTCRVPAVFILQLRLMLYQAAAVLCMIKLALT